MNRYLAEAEQLLRSGDYSRAAALCRKSIAINRDMPIALRMEARLARRSPLLAQRVRFVERVPYDRFLARVAAADVLLDTVHFNGQNTTLEAFACATPVVTLPGGLQRGRHGYGLYSAMGFMELVAGDAEDYARKAVRVAGDAAFRAHCVERISQLCPRVFEDQRVIDGMQDALERMVKDAVP